MDVSPMVEYNERELEDDYPINPGFLYVVGGEVWRSAGATTAGLMRMGRVKSVKNCDIKGRGLWHLMI